jgi:hypothetical protein
MSSDWALSYERTVVIYVAAASVSSTLSAQFKTLGQGRRPIAADLFSMPVSNFLTAETGFLGQRWFA